MIGTTLAHAVHHAATKSALNSKVEADRLVAEEDEALRERILDVIDSEAFHTVYQPVADLATDRVVGLEALTRFTGPGSMPPDRWFNDAAKIGLGVTLELAAARRALDALSNMPSHLYLSINVSPRPLPRPTSSIFVCSMMHIALSLKSPNIRCG